MTGHLNTILGDLRDCGIEAFDQFNAAYHSDLGEYRLYLHTNDGARELVKRLERLEFNRRYELIQAVLPRDEQEDPYVRLRQFV